MKKAIILSVLMMFSAALQAQETIEAKYQRGCFACHGTGMAGVPKTGDTAAWAPRLAQGIEVMLDHAEQGINAMPPKGLCPDCSRDDLKALIDFMTVSK